MNDPKRNPLSCDAVGQRSHELINYPDPSIPLWISRLDKLEDFWEPDIWRSTRSIVISIAAAITVIWIGNLRAVQFTILNIWAKIKKIWSCGFSQILSFYCCTGWSSEEIVAVTTKSIIIITDTKVSPAYKHSVNNCISQCFEEFEEVLNVASGQGYGVFITSMMFVI